LSRIGHQQSILSHHLITPSQVQEAMLTGESVPTSKITHPVPAGAPLGDRK
jgi:magnesium-transporting ATPase (P-type)